MKYLIIIIVFIFFSVGANSEIKNDRLWIETYNDCHGMYFGKPNSFFIEAHSRYCKCNVNLIFKNFTKDEIIIFNNLELFQSDKKYRKKIS